jgi:hypothetical protein
MSNEVSRLATKEELASLDKNDFFIKVKVEFGPAFTKQKGLTKRQMIELLRKNSEHWKGFIGPMLAHFAEHLEFNGHLDEPARLHMLGSYGGCGSCYADGVEGSLCTDDDGKTTCDKVCGGRR